MLRIARSHHLQEEAHLPRRHRRFVLSIIAALAAAIVGNLIVTPMWLGVPFEAVTAMIIPILIPFNLLKGLLNAVLTLVIYKSISNLITPKKDQTKGR